MIRSVGSGDGACNEKVKPQEVALLTYLKTRDWVQYFLSLHKDMFMLIYNTRNTDVIIYNGKTIILSDPAVREGLSRVYPQILLRKEEASVENGEVEDELIGMNPRID